MSSTAADKVEDHMNKFLAVAKSPKVLITGAVLLAFAMGAIFQGYTKFGSTKAASNSTEAIAAGANSMAADTNESMNPNEAAYPGGPTYAPPESPAEVAPAAASSAPPEVQPAATAPVTHRSSAPRPVHRKRSLQKEALIVGGSAAGGAAIGGIAGGGKGAGIGALSGGAAGLIYDLATKNK